MHSEGITLYVTLDIGKNVHWFGAYEGAALNPVVEPFKVRSNQTGFEQISAILEALLTSGDYRQVMLGHEPTGVYHEAWSRALSRRYEPHLRGQRLPALSYQFVNPLLSSRKREELARGRPRKTDRVDLRAIAHCLRDGLGQPAFLPEPACLRFQFWGKAWRRASREQRVLAAELLTQVDRLWPGAVVNLKRFSRMHPDLDIPAPLVSSRPLERQRLRVILQHCPNPHDFLALGPAGIRAFYRDHLGRCGPVTANLAFQWVSRAVLPPPPVAALLAEQLRFDFNRYRQVEQRLADLATQVGDLIPDSPAAVLVTIPGVSPLLAARYLAHLGHPRRFVSAAEIWSFAGFDINHRESGDSRHLGHITKMGNPGLRDTLYLIGLHTARHVPAIGLAKQRALANGKGRVGATLHAAHKANRLCHHLLFHQQPFDPNLSR
ncbi:MAG: hypothetical protein Kow0031_39360 [Anaerolineae bacterium]